jgi:WD40 repeat protein/mono/diheme cytochrome c family protein
MDEGRGWHGAARWWLISFLVASTGGLGRAELAEGTAGEALRLLRVNCVSCHSAEKLKGGLNLSSRDGMLKGGDEGPVVVEGKPEESPLITTLAPDADPHMPPKKQLVPAQIAVLSDWLRAGAPWDEGAAASGLPSPRAVALGPLPSGYRPIMALAVSPDGTQLAVGCGPEVVLFEVDGPRLKLRARSRAHLDPVQSVAWSPDGRRLVTGAFRRVLIWDAASLAVEREVLSGLTDRILALAVLPGSQEAVLADGMTGEIGSVRVLDMATGGITRSWKAHNDTIFAIALAGDGTRLATAGGDGLVRVWEVATGNELARLEAHTSQVLALAINHDATQLVTGGEDRQLKVWDLATRENIVALASKGAAFNAVTWQANGPVTAATADGTLFRYTDMKAHTGAQSSDTGNEREVGRAESPVFCVGTTPDGGHFFAGTHDGRLLSWDKDGRPSDPIDVSSVTTSTASAAESAPQ